MNEKVKDELPRFLGQWNAAKRPSWAQTFKEPSCTIPDQTMTIQEIIAKFTRTGLVPQSFLKRDEGGNEAFEPDFDPLDEGQQFLEQAAADEAAQQAPPPGAPGAESVTPPPEGKGGE